MMTRLLAEAGAADSAVTGIFTDLQATLTGVIVPAFFALVAVGIGITLAIKYVKRGASKA